MKDASQSNESRWLPFLAGKLTDVPSNTSWLLLNLKAKGFYRVNYDKRNWMMLIEQLKKDHTVSESSLLCCVVYCGHQFMFHLTAFWKAHVSSRGSLLIIDNILLLRLHRSVFLSCRHFEGTRYAVGEVLEL